MSRPRPCAKWWRWGEWRTGVRSCRRPAPTGRPWTPPCAGYLTELADVRASRLSGGQYQRALIARALCTEPALLVLDEPLAALDMETQEALARRLLRLKDDGLGLLVVLHELGPMEDIIDRSIVLKGGRVIYDGPLRSGPGASDHHHPGDESGRDLLGHPLSGRGH